MPSPLPAAPSGDHASGGMRRVAIAFLVAGALAALAGTVAPDSDPSDHAALGALAATAAVLAAGLAAWREPPPDLLAWLPTLGIVLVGVAVASARPLAATPTYYLLPVLASAYFSSRRRLLVDMAAFAGSLALVLALWAEPDVRVAIFPETVIPAVCVALVVGGLRRRLDARVELHRLAATDSLTGVLNHGAFRTAFDQRFAQTQQGGTELSLLLLDIDHFKRVNDTLGHQEGDRLLKVVGEALAAEKRRDDVLGRVGGEEFALLLASAGVDAANLVAERIRAALRAATDGDRAPLTVSVGIAARTSAVGSPEALLEAADAALYAAKAAGRDRAVAAGGPAALQLTVARPVGA